jgi:hypothetical protein
MKIRLLRASNTVKQIEFAAILPSLEIQRLAVDLMFENFERTKHTYGRRKRTPAVHVTKSKSCPPMEAC